MIRLWTAFSQRESGIWRVEAPLVSAAQDDLVEIAFYIAQDNPAAARAWVKRLRERARKAAASPLAGRYVPERRREHIREVFLRTYRIVYRIQPGEILILTVLEGHRLLRVDRLHNE